MRGTRLGVTGVPLVPRIGMVFSGLDVCNLEGALLLRAWDMNLRQRTKGVLMLLYPRKRSDCDGGIFPLAEWDRLDRIESCIVQVAVVDW